jgi:hypothetical protein
MRPEGELEVFGFRPWDEEGISRRVAEPLEEEAAHLRTKEIKEDGASLDRG